MLKELYREDKMLQLDEQVLTREEIRVIERWARNTPWDSPSNVALVQHLMPLWEMNHELQAQVHSLNAQLKILIRGKKHWSDLA